MTRETHRGTRLSRRELGRLALAIPAAGLLPAGAGVLAATGQLSRPDSVYGGVTIGINSPYSFGNEVSDAESLLRALVQLGCSSVELRSDVDELYAGAPASAARGRAGGRGRGGPASDVGRGGVRGGAAGVAAVDTSLRDWRTSAPLDHFRELRRAWEEAGVFIHAYRITLTADMRDAEFDYAFTAAKTLGASQVSMELPADLALTERMGHFAARHEVFAGYHLHTTSSLTAWEAALRQSPFNAAQVDVGHYVAGTGESPIPVLKKHAPQIASLHLKDRKSPANGATNASWGQGDTPLIEILHYLKNANVTYPAFIELEHMGQLPPGANRMVELYKCLQFCREALV